jgi:uncharacterized protein YecT (DUF1311 family)
MKTAKTIFLIVALSLIAQPVTAHRQLLAHAWEFQPQRCSPSPQNLRRQLLCSDPDLRAADIALSNAYQKKIAQLELAQVDALRIDSKVWWQSTCVGAGAMPLLTEVARICLKRKLTERRQFVVAFPTDRPKAAYLFSHTELGLLRTYLGQSGGLTSGIANDRDALAVGMRRVFAALLSKPEPPFENMGGYTADDFMNAALVDTASLEDGRYFVDYASDPHNDLLPRMFVVDLETGETTLAFIDDEVPSLEIWQKECISDALSDESFVLFQKSALHVATWSPVSGAISPVTGESQAYSQWLSTPCK